MPKSMQALLIAIFCGLFPLAALGQPRQSPSIPGTTKPSQEFTYKTTSKGPLKLLVDYPEDWKASDKRPGIVFFFGGGWNKGTTGQFEDQARYLALRGMVAVRADYRVKSRHGVTPVECVEDAKSALRWVCSHAAELGIDLQKIIAAGGSAGGHLAACTATVSGFEAEGEATAVASRPVALVLFNPVVNLAEPELAKRLEGNMQLAKQISPLHHVSSDTPPALLMFGTDDRLLNQAQQYIARCKELGVRAELYTAPDQGHSFFNRSPWKERTLARAEEFLTSLGYLEGPSKIKLP